MQDNAVPGSASKAPRWCWSKPVIAVGLHEVTRLGDRVTDAAVTLVEVGQGGLQLVDGLTETRLCRGGAGHGGTQVGDG